MKKRIYLDYAATTPISEKVAKAMQPWFTEKFGNPLSLHQEGEEAQEAIQEARKKVARFLQCSPEEIIFTSGATESNNTAIKGVLKYHRYKEKNPFLPHLITTAFEHNSVLKVFQEIEKKKLAEVTYLPVYREGIVKADDVKKAIKENTILVSIMYVNNEIGTIQPIAEIGEIIQECQKKQKIYFHTDAVQALNYLDCRVDKLKVDLLSLSGHKIYGPKGIGALYFKKGTKLEPILEGGGQENGWRSGTHNVPGIVGLGAAIEDIKPQPEIKKMRDYLIKKILQEIPQSHLNGSADCRVDNNINIRFDGVEGESLVLLLNAAGISAGTGSACSSHSLKPSHVLLALGLKPEETHGSLRFTLGKGLTFADLDYTAQELKKIVLRLRQISGDVLKNFS